MDPGRLIVIAVLSATHDIAIDGYYIRTLAREDQAALSGLRVMAYRLALLTGKGLLIALGADHALINRTGDVAGWAHEITGGAGVLMVFDHVGTALFPASLFALGVRGRLVNCGNSSGDTATIPSLGYVYHHGISILGSDPYRPEEFGPAWRTFCVAEGTGAWPFGCAAPFPWPAASGFGAVR